MKTTKELNNLSDKFLDKFYKDYPRLKQGEVKTFEVIKKRTDPNDPKKLRMAFSRNVPARDVVYDPGDETYKEIAFIDSIGTDGKPILGAIQFLKRSGGFIKLRGGSARDQNLYEYLCLSNYRGDKKGRDTSKVPIYNLVDPKADAKERREVRKKADLARDMIKDMSDEKARVYVAAKGGDYRADMDIIWDRIEDDADKDPVAFVAFAHDQNTEKRAVVNMALEQGKIEIDLADNKILWGETKKTICVVPRGEDHVDTLVTFFYKDQASHEVYKELKRLVTGTKKAAITNAKSK